MINNSLIEPQQKCKLISGTSMDWDRAWTLKFQCGYEEYGTSTKDRILARQRHEKECTIKLRT